MSGGWIDQARRPVADVARELAPESAITSRGSLWCPSCKRERRSKNDRKRGPVNIVGETGWSCKCCDAKGDWLDYACIALQGKPFKQLLPESRHAVRDWFASMGWCDPWKPGRRRAASRARRRLRPRPAHRPPPPLRAPRGELEALWAASHPLGGVRDKKVAGFVEARGLEPYLHFLQHFDLVRVLPSDPDPYPPCWKPGRRYNWRIAVRAWDRLGRLSSLHARVSTPDAPIFQQGTDHEHRGPKTLWPRHPDEGSRYEITGLFFADESGLAVARGTPSPHMRRVFFAEGLTDWLAAAARFGGEQILDTDPHVGSGCNAVYGGVSGSFPTLGSLPFPASLPHAPLHFYAALDPDAAGRAYLLQLAEGLHPRPLERIPLERWREPLGLDADAKIDLSIVLQAGVPGAALIEAAERVDLEALRAQVERDRQARAGNMAAAGDGDEPPPPADPDAPSSGGEDDDDELRTINVSNRQMADLVDEAWDATNHANTPPRLFLRSGRTCMIRRGDNDAVRIEDVDRAGMQGFLARSARWTRWRRATAAELKAGMDSEERAGFIEAECDQPPTYLAPDMLVFPDDALPPLQAVVASPVYDAAGRLVATPGYSPTAHLWYEPPGSFELPSIAVAPSDEAVEAARKLICEVWLGDFPFVKNSDRAHAIAIALLPFVRRLVHSPTPLHLVEAAVAGTGKSLLARVLLTVGNGRLPEPVTYTPNDEETRKAITSYLSDGAAIMFLDDVQGRMASPSLARALASELWKDRMLGTNATIQCVNHATWVATANNVQLNTDIARRSVRVRLDRGMQRPWEWKGAKIKHLDTWTLRHRGELIAALLTLVQAWLSRGRPEYGHTLGSFDSWAKVVGGILQTAGIDGFLEDMADLYDSADSDMAEWYALIETWWEKHPDRQYDEYHDPEDGRPRVLRTMRTKAMRASEIGDFARNEKLLGEVMGDKSERSQNTRLGKAIRRLRDRVMEGVRIRTRQGRRGAEYWLERHGETAAERREREAGMLPGMSSHAARPYQGAQAPPGAAQEPEDGSHAPDTGHGASRPPDAALPPADELPPQPPPADDPYTANGSGGGQQSGWAWGTDDGFIEDPDAHDRDGGWDDDD